MSEGYSGGRLAVAGAIAALAVTAVGTGSYFGALYAPHSQYGYATGPVAGAKSQRVSQIDRDRAGLPDFAERIASGPDPKDDSERELRDLAAQESMSVWAFWLLLTTIVGTVTTMFGTGLLLWQIILTRKAVEDTGKATDAVEEANRIARDADRRASRAAFATEQKERLAAAERRRSERRQLRAYVDFEQVLSVVDRRWKRASRDRHSWRGVKVDLKNFGQTPADDLELKILFTFQPRDGAPTALGEFDKAGLGAIMPSAICAWTDFIEFPDKLWEEIGNERASLLVSIVANYKDAFGDPHTLSSVYALDRWIDELGFVPGTRIHT